MMFSIREGWEKLRSFRKSISWISKKLSRSVQSLVRKCIHPAWIFPLTAEARQGQLKMIALVTLSQGDPEVEGTWRLTACYHFSLFLWVSSHAEWICDSLNKHSGEWFLASPSHVFKSGLHHPSKYERKKKVLENQMTVFSQHGWRMFSFCLCYYGKEYAGMGWALNWMSVLPASGLVKKITAFQVAWKV